MPYFIQAALAATLFCIAQSANALIVSVTLDSFEATPVTVTGVGTGGGRGNFTLNAANDVIPEQLANILDGEFSAICLEPNSFISTNQEYRFAVVPLAEGPTLGTGSMGPARQAAVEALIGRLGLGDASEINLQTVALMTAVLYEAGYEALINPLDVYNGVSVLSGNGTADAQLALNLAQPPMVDADAYALINLGPTNAIATRSVFEGQDFAVWTTSVNTVGAPGIMALFGIGLMGLAGIIRLREKA